MRFERADLHIAVVFLAIVLDEKRQREEGVRNRQTESGKETDRQILTSVNGKEILRSKFHNKNKSSLVKTVHITSPIFSTI